MAQGTRHRCALGKGEFSPYPIRGPESTKTGSLRLPEVLENNVYFAREERAPLQLRQRRQGGVFQHERLQLQPGRRRLDVREIHLGQLRPALTLYFVMIVFHRKIGMFFGTAKIRNFPQIRKEMRRFLGQNN